ncbi:MAG: hypothetical protein AB9915_03585 [Candidatus Dojkabacteria bacterium]
MAISKNLVHIFLLLCAILFFLNVDFTNLIAPLFVFLFLMIINLFKKSFGFGDMLILVGIGLILNYRQFLVMFWVGIIIALLYSIFVIFSKKIDIKKSKVPMVPFFSISFVISILWGYDIFSVLLKFIGI